MTAKLPNPTKRTRLVKPPKGAIPEAGNVAELSMTQKGDTWSYEGKPGQTGAEATAALYLHPGMSAAPVIREFTGNADMEMHGLVNELQAQVEAVNAGDMSRPEAMLVAQAHTLDAVFNALLARGQRNMAEYPDAMERYLRLAFKAQSQCRATLETLGQIKNPTNIAFVRQANIAHGPQQVNNSQPPARAGELQSEQTKVLEDQRGKWMDPGAQEAAGRLNQAMATLGALNRPQVPEGKSESEPQRLQGRASAPTEGDGANAESIEASAGRVLTLPRKSSPVAAKT